MQRASFSSLQSSQMWIPLIKIIFHSVKFIVNKYYFIFHSQVLLLTIFYIYSDSARKITKRIRFSSSRPITPNIVQLVADDLFLSSKEWKRFPSAFLSLLKTWIFYFKIGFLFCFIPYLWTTGEDFSSIFNLINGSIQHFWQTATNTIIYWDWLGWKHQ